MSLILEILLTKILLQFEMGINFCIADFHSVFQIVAVMFSCWYLPKLVTCKLFEKYIATTLCLWYCTYLFHCDCFNTQYRSCHLRAFANPVSSL